jgi:hypothetical protein
MNEQTERLTNLAGPKHPHQCQACGGEGRLRWQECDHRDQPELRLVVLCQACSDKLVEPHPRLYNLIHQNAPWPGCMDLCLNCAYREGISCQHPQAKANGGEGVSITVTKPARMFVDGVRAGKRFGYHQEIYGAPPVSCAQYVAAECQVKNP